MNRLRANGKASCSTIIPLCSQYVLFPRLKAYLGVWQSSRPKIWEIWIDAAIHGKAKPSESNTMYVTYFDEVKANPTNGQNNYYVGGICVPMAAIDAIEAKVTKLAEETFGSTELTPATEFHASYIYFGKGPFKGMQADKRLDILAALTEIVCDRDVVGQIYAEIDTAKLYAGTSAPEVAFIHFCERVQMHVGKANRTILIGDLDDEQSSVMIKDFAQYRARGTPWAYGIEVPSIVDTVHFAKSHHSRMIQLADIYLFAISHRSGSRKGWMADGYTQRISECNLFPSRYKTWPK